ncbi:MAG: 2-oxoglutarate dehydrogenase E1 component [Gammaproteobacteria bacterium]|nr:2-oxoglutarate dehydrogenase E1 component [Gammaproteobacteria bacterium]
MKKDWLLLSGGEQLNSGSVSYIEGLYEDYLAHPDSVPASWQKLFNTLETLPLQGASSLADSERSDTDLALELDPDSYEQSVDVFGLISAVERMAEYRDELNRKQVDVVRLISAYRYLGHRQADIDPLNATARPDIPELNPEFHGLSHKDMDTVFETGGIGDVKHAPLREILSMLSVTYCGTIGSEFKHITSLEQKEWIQRRLEQFHFAPELSDKRKRRILEILISAKSLEVYLHKKYVGQKRFSLEGGLSLIPIIDELIKSGGRHHVKEVILGMAHRGRLNMLVNILGKNPETLFKEFEDKLGPEQGSGDVKYHKGFSSDLATEWGPVHTVLAFNPSHLEAINPVVAGSVRARQERRGDISRKEVVPILIHGDAAIAGQGVVMETLNLSKTRGYSTGGTIHVVVNNQIGFTTSDPLDSRSTLYCSDVAKVVQAPVFHVNGDDPEAAVFVAQLAVDYRMKYNCDVVIDMVCYRQHGHNEADEPAVTQPLMYRSIRNQLGVTKSYSNQLVQDGTITPSRVKALETKYLNRLQKGQRVCGPIAKREESQFLVDYKPYLGTGWREPASTCISEERIQKLTQRLTTVPEGFVLHRIVQKIVQSRKKMGCGELPADWGFGENLAYASLLEDGYPVRLSGQDCVRGTFFHRHVGFHDQATGEVYIPLQHVTEDQPLFLPINSLLSEEAVLGFEVGYSTTEPESLVIWEAQFGDFANNAQVYVDQFLSSSEAKWQRYCGLVMLLPHGYDGQGPEHSSARLERYLQLCAEENLQVCMPSTPAQIFHLLRRQMIRPYRKPLIVMTPKNILRDVDASSQISEFSEGGFQVVIDAAENLKAKSVRKIIFCAGKLYYELLRACHEHKITDIAIVRIEQLYPFPQKEVKQIIGKYSAAREIIWTQEEPRNQGAWYYMQSRRHLKACLKKNQQLRYAGRSYSASPAAGSLQVHRRQQLALIHDALGISKQAVRGPSLRAV